MKKLVTLTLMCMFVSSVAFANSPTPHPRRIGDHDAQQERREEHREARRDARQERREDQRESRRNTWKDRREERREGQPNIQKYPNRNGAPNASQNTTPSQSQGSTSNPSMDQMQ